MNKGLEHVDMVKVDQINNAVIEVMEDSWRTTQSFRRSVCMRVAPLLSGNQGEEAHQE